MNKPKKNTYNILLIAAGIVILAVFTVFSVSRAMGAEQQQKEAQGNAQQEIKKQQEVKTQKEEAPADLKEYSAYIVKRELGDKNSKYKDRLRNVEISKSRNENNVVIELNGNDGFTKEMTIRGMLMDCKKIYKGLAERKDISKVTVSEYLEVADMDGSPMDEWVFTLSIDKNELDKAVSENTPVDELPKAAYEYKLHPNLEK
ncbi:MAG: hypothetical protein ACM3TR_00695 [Caulobacteraceae bacterium]